MKTTDFKKQEDELYDFSFNALREIGSGIRDELSYFAFDCNPEYGEVLLCLDTIQNSIITAKNTENYITEKRKENSYDSPAFKLAWAIHNLGNNLIGWVLPFGNNTGDFSHQGFAEYHFEDWEDFSLSDSYPGEFEKSEEDYLACISTILLSNVIDRLISNNAFSELKICKPFYCGVALHDNIQNVVRIINW